MAERTAITQVVQIGLETTPGTIVPATKKLASMDIETKVMSTTDIFRPAGFKYPTVTAQEKEWVEGTMKGQPTYTEIIYPLASIIQKPANPTQILDGATPTGGYKWVFDTNTTAPDVLQTYTVEQGDSSRMQSFGNGVFQEFGFDFTREKVEMAGKLLGQAIDNTNPGLTPALSSVALIPIQATHLSMFMDTTFAGIGGTKLTRLFDAKYLLSNRLGPVWVVDSAQKSYVAVVETVPKQTLKIIVEANAAGMAQLDRLRAATRQFCRVLATGNTIYNTGTFAAVPLTYSYQMDLAVDVTETGAFSDQQGVYGIEFTLEVMHDAGWGKAAHFEVVNKIATM